MNRMIDQLIVHEGMRSNFYKCTSNKTTVGIGRNVDAKPFTEAETLYLGRTTFAVIPMTLEEATWLLTNDLDTCTFQLLTSGAIQGVSGLSEARRAVCVNMVYNMGISGFCKFRKMIKAINNSDFKLASVEMLDSRWANQVGNRATELSIQMLTGEFDVG